MAGVNFPCAVHCILLYFLLAACQANILGLVKVTGGETGTLPTLPPCKDLDTRCYLPSGDVCTTYREWSRVYCKAHCGYCQKVEEKKMCRDTIPDCASYGQVVCTNQNHRVWVDANCPLYCRRYYCSNRPPPTPVPSCGDTRSDCADFGQSTCQSPNYVQWVLDNCRKFCNKC